MFDIYPHMKSNVTLYTSLPPKIERDALGQEIGTEYQRACIASWRRLGFNVVSLNSRPEMDLLLRAGYDINFHEVNRKPPRIVDFFHAIRSSGNSVAGIINADCLLLGEPATISAVLRTAEKGLVLIERMNLRARDARVTGVSCGGFDFFCFRSDILHGLNFDEEISIGTPWWDYWFPLAFQQLGGKLFSAPAPMLMHLDHSQNWSQEAWYAQGRRMHTTLALGPTAALAFPFIQYGPHEELTDEAVHSFSVEVFQWLRRTSAPLQVDNPYASFVFSFLSGLDQTPRLLAEGDARLTELHQALSRRESKLRAAETELRATETKLRATETKLRAIEDSVVWKLTRPIRAIAGWFGSRIDGTGMLR